MGKIAEDEKVDFVILWVDGNDPEWQASKAKYTADKGQDASANRYREWENLKYWFRGVEKFAPWVNNVYFVTCGHYPGWLNLEHPKLRFVRHEDFIPKECLPTFSSRPIDMNLHRIEELSEHFVYFNDDMFLIDKVEKTDFFRNGKPCDMLCEYPLGFSGKTYVFSHTMVNNMNLMGKYFKRKQIKKDLKKKMLSPKYGKYAIYNWIMYMLPFPNLIGVLSHHLPMANLKSTYQEFWEKEPEILNETISHRFRSISDVNQFVFRYWNLFRGNFEPFNVLKLGKMYAVGADNRELYDTIRNQKKRMICINDTCTQEEFEEAKPKVIECFEHILPEKSSFEL